MTQDEQDCDLQDAQAHLGGAGWTADRFRHESIEDTSLLIYNEKQRHIGSITRLPGGSAYRELCAYRWEVTRMARGMPVSRRSTATLAEALNDLRRYGPQFSSTAR